MANGLLSHSLRFGTNVADYGAVAGVDSAWEHAAKW
jgi:hypothetical protein